MAPNPLMYFRTYHNAVAKQPFQIKAPETTRSLVLYFLSIVLEQMGIGHKAPVKTLTSQPTANPSNPSIMPGHRMHPPCSRRGYSPHVIVLNLLH